MNISIFLEDYILRLDVTMNNIMRMKILETLNYTSRDKLCIKNKQYLFDLHQNIHKSTYDISDPLPSNTPSPSIDFLDLESYSMN